MYRALIRGAVALVLVTGAMQPSMQTVTAQAPAESSAVGTLASYEARTRSLSIRTDKGPVEFTLGDKATVRVGSHVLSEGEIAAQTGRRVKVRYTQASGKRVVQTMMISRPPLDERLFLSPHP